MNHERSLYADREACLRRAGACVAAAEAFSGRQAMVDLYVAEERTWKPLLVATFGSIIEEHAR